MKKHFAILIAIMAFLICAFSLSACKSCKIERPTREELIPETLGEPEGLWLYLGNSRMRTDGSEQETLLTSVTIDGEDYDAENFTIGNLCYVTDTNKIFFSLSQTADENSDEYFLYVYDYKQKTGEYVCPLSCRGTGFILDNENYLVYAHNGTDGLLLDYDGKIRYRLHESIAYESEYEYAFSGYSNGVLYSAYSYKYWEETPPNEFNYQCKYFLEWWTKGQTHRVEMPSSVSANEVTVTATHLFVLYGQKITSVNLTTEAVTVKDFYELTYDETVYESATRSIKKIVYRDDAVFALTITKLYKSASEYDDVSHFYKIDDCGITVIAEFTYKDNSVVMHEYGGYIYLGFNTADFGDSASYKYYRYDLQSGEIKGISTNEYHGPASASRPASVRVEKRVGDYLFYVSNRGYGLGDWFGYKGWCYYLNREHDGETEIMQYSFDSKYFFDDICDF